MNNNMIDENRQYLAKAFLSCSLRKEDENFVNLISNILQHYKIQPFGTVGRYEASPEYASELMRRNIDQSDFIVIAATKRYITRDTHTNLESSQLSEMLHSEAGMAFAFGKPVVVFTETGTNPGNFLASITQYISLDGTQENLDNQSNLIVSLLKKACEISQELKRVKAWNGLGQLLIGGLAFYGSLKLIEGGNDEC